METSSIVAAGSQSEHNVTMSDLLDDRKDPNVPEKAQNSDCCGSGESGERLGDLDDAAKVVKFLDTVSSQSGPLHRPQLSFRKTVVIELNVPDIAIYVTSL